MNCRSRIWELLGDGWDSGWELVAAAVCDFGWELDLCWDSEGISFPVGGWRGKACTEGGDFDLDFDCKQGQGQGQLQAQGP